MQGSPGQVWAEKMGPEASPLAVMAIDCLVGMGLGAVDIQAENLGKSIEAWGHRKALGLSKEDIILIKAKIEEFGLSANPNHPITLEQKILQHEGFSFLWPEKELKIPEKLDYERFEKLGTPPKLLDKIAKSLHEYSKMPVIIDWFIEHGDRRIWEKNLQRKYELFGGSQTAMKKAFDENKLGKNNGPNAIHGLCDLILPDLAETDPERIRLQPLFNDIDKVLKAGADHICPYDKMTIFQKIEFSGKVDKLAEGLMHLIEPSKE